jgi:putative transposase
MQEYADCDVGTLAVSWPADARNADWGKTGNKKLHTWSFDRLYQYLDYKGEERGVEVLKENEWIISYPLNERTQIVFGEGTPANRPNKRYYRAGLSEPRHQLNASEQDTRWIWIASRRGLRATLC